MSNQKQAAKRIGKSALGVVAVGAAAVSYAHFVEPHRMQAVRYDVGVVDLPESLDGFCIAHLTDFHLGGGWDNRRAAKRSIAVACESKPDLITFTGDVAHQGHWVGGDEMLSQLVATAPTIAILGNHDWRHGESGAGEIRDRLNQLGIPVLSNDAKVVERTSNHAELLVVGVDDGYTGHADADAAMQKVGEHGHHDLPAILLTHVPDVIDDVPNGRFALTLAGHTHGGQVRLSPFKRNSPFDFPMHMADLNSQYVRGTHVVNGNPLFVGNGTGASGMPFRFLAPPQTAIFTLRRGVDTTFNEDDERRYFELKERKDERGFAK